MSAITITVPETLYKKVKELAERDNSSVEQFAVLALAEKMSSIVTTEYLEERSRRASPGSLSALLSKAPNTEPIAGDEIEFVSDEEQRDIEATLAALDDEDKQAAKRFHRVAL